MEQLNMLYLTGIIYDSREKLFKKIIEITYVLDKTTSFAFIVDIALELWP